MDAQGKDKDQCCPRFEPTRWDGKVIEWNGKKFIKDRVRTLFYIPMNFGQVMKRLDERVRKAGTSIDDGLALSDHTSKWNMDIYVAVDREVPGVENVTLSGKFLSKVYEGDFRETERWCKDFEAYAKAKGMKIGKLYMWYTTCPKCAKRYGKNYVALMANVD